MALSSIENQRLWKVFQSVGQQVGQGRNMPDARKLAGVGKKSARAEIRPTPEVDKNGLYPKTSELSAIGGTKYTKRNFANHIYALAKVYFG